MSDPTQELDNALSAGEDLFNKGKETAKKSLGQVAGVVAGVGKSVESFLKDPLPTLETAAIVWASGGTIDPATASAIVSAANGGSMEQIAISAAAAYAGGKIGVEAGSAAAGSEFAGTLSPADQALLKQVVTSASGSAAATALRPGSSLDDVLTAGVAGSVNGYVTDALKAQGFTNADNKVVAGATAAATKAILKGTSVADAIGQSVAAVAISQAISGNVDQLNKNNELGSSLSSKFEDIKASAQKYFDDNKIADLEAQAQKEYEAAKAASDSYSTLKNTFDTAYAEYQKNADAYNNYNPEIHTEPKDSYMNAANKAVDTLNDLSAKITDVSKTATDAIATYTKTADVLKPIVEKYNTDYVSPINEINTKIDELNKENTTIAQSIGQDVVKYNQQLEVDKTDLTKTIGEEAVKQAQDAIDAQAKADEDAKVAAQAAADAQAKTESEKVATEQPAVTPEKPVVDESNLANLTPEELARYKATQEGATSPLENVPAQDLGVTQENVDEYQKNLQDLWDAGGFATQWKPDEEGGHTYTADDGSTITLDASGNVVGYTEAAPGALLSDLKTTPAKPTTPVVTPAAPAPAVRPGTNAAQAGILGLISQLQGMQGQQMAQQAQQQPQPTPVVETGPDFSLEGPLDVGYFGDWQRQKQAQKDTQSQDGTVKIASGGFMDDLLELLHKRG